MTASGNSAKHFSSTDRTVGTDSRLNSPHSATTITPLAGSGNTVDSTLTPSSASSMTADLSAKPPRSGYPANPPAGGYSGKRGVPEEVAVPLVVVGASAGGVEALRAF